MKRDAAENLVRRNAWACENALRSRCECACGGALHGSAHEERWIKEQIERLVTGQLALPIEEEP